MQDYKDDSSLNVMSRRNSCSKSKARDYSQLFHLYRDCCVWEIKCYYTHTSKTETKTFSANNPDTEPFGLFIQCVFPRWENLWLKYFRFGQVFFDFLFFDSSSLLLEY